MAERNIILLTKRSEIPSQSLPTSTKRGEAVVNLGDGILYYSGGTSGSPTWIPSGLNSGYFEVGSHLTNQYLDGKITGYEGTSGAGLVNKYLKGTASGFTLDDISPPDKAAPAKVVMDFTPRPDTLTVLAPVFVFPGLNSTCIPSK